jgi:hypothetical protein
MRHEVFPLEGKLQPFYQRRDERLLFDVVTDVRISGRAWQKVRLTDLSVRGFRIARLSEGRVGQVITIRIRGIEPLRAVIRRNDTSGVGCEFARPLSVYVLDHLARHGSQKRVDKVQQSAGHP